MWRVSTTKLQNLTKHTGHSDNAKKKVDPTADEDVNAGSLKAASQDTVSPLVKSHSNDTSEQLRMHYHKTSLIMMIDAS